ncbi:hypothetical protein Q604_UNBC18428G0003 [human gut metagenome]|uniref:Uncharacterized protein n=1 Tax=human gut metagenome TaxID=408170 RepID=W1WUZ6_9ZZZZ
MKNFIDISSFEIDGNEVDNNIDFGKNVTKSKQEYNKLIHGSNQSISYGTSGDLSITGVKSNAASGGLIVCDIINNAISAIDNIITSFNQVRVEKEKTKQVEFMTKAYITKVKEDTKQVRIKEKEETKRIKMQLYYDYVKYKASLFEIAKNFEHKNNELNESTRRFNENLAILRQTINNQLNDIKKYNDLIFSEFKKGNVVDEQILNYNQGLQEILNKTLDKLLKL